jgi:hypothetical protein
MRRAGRAGRQFRNVDGSDRGAVEPVAQPEILRDADIQDTSP